VEINNKLSPDASLATSNVGARLVNGRVVDAKLEKYLELEHCLRVFIGHPKKELQSFVKCKLITIFEKRIDKLIKQH